MDGERKERVNWALVEEQLSGISDAWKEARFDTLPHVVDVLTSDDPKEQLGALRRQRDSIEELVDDVVSIYHVGFNKAIHNYSQILSLFSESADLMSGLKDNLSEARRLLSNRHKQLYQLWFRSIQLRHTITLIDQIDTIAKVPARIEQLVKEGRLYAAVQLHLHSLASLEREGISSVGALRDVRNELSSIRGQLFIRVVEDLQAHIYGKGEYSPKAEVVVTESAAADEDSEAADDVSTIVPAPVPATAPLHPALAAQGITLPSSAGKSKQRNGRSVRAKVGSTTDVRGLAIDTGSSGAGDDGDETGTQSPRSEASGTSSAQMSDGAMVMAVHRKAAAVPPKWLAEATVDAFYETLVKKDVPLHVKYLMTMVECLGLLGKIAAAGTILSQRVRTSIREIIIAEIRESAAAAEAARPRLERHVLPSPHAPAAGGGAASGATGSAVTPRGPRTPGAGSGGGFGGPGGGTAVAPVSSTGASGSAGSGAAGGSNAATPVGALHDPHGPSQVAAQELLERIMKRLTRVLENNIVVGELMEAKAEGARSRNTTASETDDDSAPTTKHSALTGGYSIASVWSCMQSECQQLLCDILRAAADGSSVDASRIGTIRFTSAAGSNSELTFSFRFTDRGGTGAAQAGDSLSLAGGGQRKGEGAGLGGVGGEGYGTGSVLQERGIYLTCACYRPTLQFTEKVCQLLPRKYADLGRQGLRPFIDAFVKDQFLPSVRNDFRGRVAEALSSPSAFRPKAKNVGVYEPTLERGRPVLQGPLAVEAIVQEVLAWAKAMPVYAGEFVALIHALLDRTLERCRAVYTESVLGSLSSSLVGRVDLDQLMAQQAAAALLDDLDTLGPAEVEAAKEDPHPDSEAHDLDLDIFAKLFALSPLKEDQLILDPGKLISLAALSDTLEYLADSILRLGRRPPTAGQPQQQQQQQKQQKTALTLALQKLSDKYRALAREALRTLRLEMQLQCIFHLQFMSKRSYLNDVDAEEPEDFIVALTSQMTRVDEEMTLYMAPPRRYYVFGGVCSLAAYGLIRALGSLSGINSLGVRQVQRNCIALQQTLATLNANSAASVQLSLDRVGEYYELLNRPYEALMAYVKDHSRYFSVEEYAIMLKVSVPGRKIPSDAVARLQALLQAY